MATRLRAWLGLAAFVPLLASACVSEEEEQQLGDAIATEINVHVPIVRDPFTVAYVDRVGQHIAATSERPHVTYRFYIVDTGTANAFALPGGHIYVTRGLILRTENLSELGAVLAHEIAHVAARHGAKSMQRELRTGSVVSTLYEIFLGREPAIFEQRALTVGRRMWFAKHSRRAEREADRLALSYMVRSGLDPDGMITILETLLEEEGETHRPPVEWFSTHPATEDRIDRLRLKLADFEATPPGPRPEAASYHLFLRRMASLPSPPLPF